MSESASEPLGNPGELRPDSPMLSTPNRSEIVREPAYASAGSWLRFLIPAGIGLGLDLWLKSWAFPDGVPLSSPVARIPAGRNPAELYDALPVVPHVLGFTTTVNHGAVFGVGQGMVWFFLTFSIFAMAMIVWVFLTSKRDQWVVHLALGMITAGALGNLYDRAVFQGVRDMLRFYVSWYPYIFNIADVMLCVGVPLLMLRWLLVKEPDAGEAVTSTGQVPRSSA